MHLHIILTLFSVICGSFLRLRFLFKLLSWLRRGTLGAFESLYTCFGMSWTMCFAAFTLGL